MIATDETFHATDVCEALGVTYRRVDYWFRTGRLPAQSPGSGNARKLSRLDALHVKALAVFSQTNLLPDPQTSMDIRHALSRYDSTFLVPVGDHLHLSIDLDMVALLTHEALDTLMIDA